MASENPFSYRIAVRDFKRARQQAAMQQLMARLTGKSVDLLAYNDVRKQLKELGIINRGLQEIHLEAIVGSVGRSNDFTRDFKPKKDADQERWARIKTAFFNMRGWAPIDVYQIGECYFVRDGNHRVSIAKQLGSSTITAYVTEVKTKVSLKMGDYQDEVNCKARYVEFLETTKLDELRPEADFLLTLCDHYESLLSQIEVCYNQLVEVHQSDLPYQEAVLHWYDHIYYPVAEIIRQQGILRNFPDRTKTDLYILCVEHHEELIQALGWHIDLTYAAADMAKKKALALRNPKNWLGLKIYKKLAEDSIVGSMPGQWREDRLAYHKYDNLFSDILVVMQQKKSKWSALDQATLIAKREKSHIFGLYVIPEKNTDHSNEIGIVQSDFNEHLLDAELDGELTVEVGEVDKHVLARAAWVDLVVIKLAPQTHSLAFTHSSSGFNRILQHCPRPILIVPSGAHSPMDRAVLAYDGSPKADEALFVAAYLASRWPISLTVVTVRTSKESKVALQGAKTYLKKHVGNNIKFQLLKKPKKDTILKYSKENNCNFLIMGAFGFRPLLNLVTGSMVNQILREFRHPVLICR